jgi:hypothetical protein
MDPGGPEVNDMHRDLALRALECGHGLNWAADITTLPLRIIIRVAAENGAISVDHNASLRAARIAIGALTGPSVSLGRIHARKAVAA